MKHIKPFNESKENLKEELQDFCETSLAYLLDNGYNVSYRSRLYNCRFSSPCLFNMG